jgi:CRISPR-associated protein Csm5
MNNGYRHKTYKVRLHVISPVHIGCDDAYEPTGFVVDRSNRQLVAFDPVEFVRGLTPEDRQKFLSICEKGTIASLVELYRFMDGRRSAATGRSVSISDGFLAGYDRVLKLTSERDIRQELNKFAISRTSYLPMDNAPYIPGSALKGALRTGWLNHLNRGTVRQVDGRNKHAGKILETDLLKLVERDISSDPFRLVKVSDFLPVGQTETMIRFAVNKKKKPSKHEPRGPQQILEVIRHDRNALFEGIITLMAPEKGASIRNPLPVELSLFQNLSAFFQKEMDEEETMLKGINLSAGIARKLREMFRERYLKDVFPLRIGRHSGAEAVTIEGGRSIKIMGKKGDPPKHGPHSTTTWLAGDTPKASTGLQPFGWVALEVMEADSKALYPERIYPERAPATLPKVAVEPPKPSVPTDQAVWESAILAWSPGNAMLSATSGDGKRAEARIGSDRTLVTDEVVTRLKKGKTVKARVSLEQQGNAFKIIKVEVLN